jgi:hypothetical protein
MYSVEINLLKDRPGFAREDLSRLDRLHPKVTGG